MNRENIVKSIESALGYISESEGKTIKDNDKLSLAKRHLKEALEELEADLHVQVDMNKLQQYSAYMQGARAGIVAITNQFPQLFKGKDAAYNKALVKLVTSSLHDTENFLMKEYEIRFRNHVQDKKGKCVACEAYFYKR